ncbi:DUF1450 domain-containing protein [Neobacillus sp. K501]
MKLFNKLLNKQNKVTIEFCQNNLDRFLSEEDFSDYQTFLNSKNVTYKEYECQSRCKECKQSPYAIINGQFVAADNSQELLDTLKHFASGKEK